MKKQYNTEEIARLLDKFMAGVSTLAEEHLLADYFRTHEVDDDWREYQEMFALFDSGAVAVRQETPKRQHRASTPFHYVRAGWAVGIAAAFLIAFLLWPKENAHTPQPVQKAEREHQQERVEAATQLPARETIKAQPQLAATAQTQPERKRKKAVPKPIEEPPQEAVPDEHPVNVEAEEPLDFYEASYRLPEEDMMTVEELRARGNRLTENIRQHLQASNVSF